LSVAYVAIMSVCPINHSAKRQSFLSLPHPCSRDAALPS
jgi:hypothetical protein